MIYSPEKIGKTFKIAPVHIWYGSSGSIRVAFAQSDGYEGIEPSIRAYNLGIGFGSSGVGPHTLWAKR